jgi:hypothetical protein
MFTPRIASNDQMLKAAIEISRSSPTRFKRHFVPLKECRMATPKAALGLTYSTLGLGRL